MRAPDLEALLVALVLAPATYSRNRFFSLYTDPEVRRVRRRASLIRGIVRHVSRIDAAAPASVLTIAPAASGRVALTYVVPAIGLRRTATLDPIELALVRFVMARGPGQGSALPGGAPSSTSALEASPTFATLAPDDADRLRIEAALVRLVAAPLPPDAIPPSAPPV